MFFQVEDGEIKGISPTKENLRGNIVASILPDDWDDERYSLKDLKWDGEKVVWRKPVEEIDTEIEREEKRRLFHTKVGIPYDLFGCFVALKKLVNGEMLTTANKKAVSDFVDKHKTIYEEVKE